MWVVNNRLNIDTAITLLAPILIDIDPTLVLSCQTQLSGAGAFVIDLLIVRYIRYAIRGAGAAADARLVHPPATVLDFLTCSV